MAFVFIVPIQRSCEALGPTETVRLASLPILMCIRTALSGPNIVPLLPVCDLVLVRLRIVLTALREGELTCRHVEALLVVSLRHVPAGLAMASTLLLACIRFGFKAPRMVPALASVFSAC